MRTAFRIADQIATFIRVTAGTFAIFLVIFSVLTAS